MQHLLLQVGTHGTSYVNCYLIQRVIERFLQNSRGDAACMSCQFQTEIDSWNKVDKALEKDSCINSFPVTSPKITKKM